MINQEYLRKWPDALQLKCLLVQQKFGSLQSFDNDLHAVPGVQIKTCLRHLLIQKCF